MKLDAQIAYAKLYLDSTPAKESVIASLEELQKIRLIKNIFFKNETKEAQAEEVPQETFKGIERLRNLSDRLRES